MSGDLEKACLAIGNLLMIFVIFVEFLKQYKII